MFSSVCAGEERRRPLGACKLEDIDLCLIAFEWNKTWSRRHLLWYSASGQICLLGTPRSHQSIYFPNRLSFSLSFFFFYKMWIIELVAAFITLKQPLQQSWTHGEGNGNEFFQLITCCAFNKLQLVTTYQRSLPEWAQTLRGRCWTATRVWAEESPDCRWFATSERRWRSSSVMI